MQVFQFLVSDIV